MTDSIDFYFPIGVPGAAYAPTAAFSIRDLSELNFANGFTYWHLKAGDRKLEDIAKPGFFNEACCMMHVGDVILVSGTEGAVQLVVRSVEPEVTTATMRVAA